MLIGQLSEYVQMITGYWIVELRDDVREGDRDMSYLPTEVIKTMTEYECHFIKIHNTRIKAETVREGYERPLLKIVCVISAILKCIQYIGLEDEAKSP